MNKIKENLNKYVISFMIVTITLFGAFSFIINKNLIDQLINYYIIGITGLSSIILFFNNIDKFKPKNIRKFPLILTIITIIWLCITIIMGIRINIESIKGLINMGLMLTIGFIIMNIDLTPSEKTYIKKSIYISFTICIILGIFQYFSGINLITYSNDLYPGILGRINSTFYIATILDKYIVLIASLLLYDLLKQPKSRKYKLLFLLAGIGISLTFSRGGQLVFLFIAGIVFILALLKKQISNVLTIIVTILFMITIPGTSESIQSGLDFVYETLNIPTSLRFDITIINDYTDKLFSKKENKQPQSSNNNQQTKPPKEPTSEPIENKSISFRDNYKKIGLELIKNYPIFGIGIGNYSYLVNNQNFKNYITDQSVLAFSNYYMYPHNTYVHTTAEVGIIGLILIFLTLMSYILYSNFKNNKLLSLSTLLLIISLLLAGYTEGVLHSKQYIFIFMILLGFLCSRDKEEEMESDIYKYFEKIYKGSIEKYLDNIKSNIKNNKKTFIVTANPEAFILAEKNDSYKKMLLDKNVDIVPDGIGLVKAGNILGYKIKERIPGIEIAQNLLEYADIDKKKVALFGSKSEVIETMKKVLKEKYPNINLVIAKDGYVKDKDKIMEEIIKKEPDVVLVALGMPLQEEIIYKYYDKFKKGILIGVGGSLDVLSGFKKRAPKIFIKLNLEWLYRIAKEPTRLKRFYNNNIKFIIEINKIKNNIIK